MAIFKRAFGPQPLPQRIDGAVWQYDAPVATIRGWCSPHMHETAAFAADDAQARQFDELYHNLSPSLQAVWQGQAYAWATTYSPMCIPQRRFSWCDIWDNVDVTVADAQCGQRWHRAANCANAAIGNPYNPYPFTPSGYWTWPAALYVGGPPWHVVAVPGVGMAPSPVYVVLYGARLQASWGTAAVRRRVSTWIGAARVPGSGVVDVHAMLSSWISRAPTPIAQLRLAVGYQSDSPWVTVNQTLHL